MEIMDLQTGLLQLIKAHKRGIPEILLIKLIDHYIQSAIWFTLQSPLFLLAKLY